MKKSTVPVGGRFGKLTVVGFAGCDSRGNSLWKCKCDCGLCVTVRAARIKSGKTKSCGCLKSENKLTHGQHGTRLYRIWANMKSRCGNENVDAYIRYGAEGKTVCEEWQLFEPFYEWAMANGYADGLTIERKDNSKGYSPENCKWATFKEQQNNRRNNHLVSYNGETKTISQWAEATGIGRGTIWARLRKGWSAEKALTTLVK